MSDKKRITIRCWNDKECGHEYTWLATFDGAAELFIACPFCGAEAVVRLGPYAPPPVVNVYTGDSPAPPDAAKPEAAEAAYTLDRLALPDVLPSEPVE
jgi:hypothetical protein